MTIDGSEKSGSGTILRYSLVAASLLCQTLKLTSIRARRARPGLMPQHLKTVQASVELTNGKVDGMYKGSMSLTFLPGPIVKGGNFTWDIGTAGSTTLMAQCLMPIAFFSSQPLVLTLSGGLFQDFAPNPFHMKHVLLSILERFSLKTNLEVITPGYYPKGGGSIRISVKPVNGPLTPVALLSQGQVEAVKGISIASNLKQGNVSQRMAEACSKHLAKNGYAADIQCIDDTSAVQKGAALMVYAITDTGCIIGADMAGRPGLKSEQIGKSVAIQLLQDIQSGATVDRFTADQLIIYAALAQGESAYIIPYVTDHVESNLWIVSHLFGASVSVKGYEIRIKGTGLKRDGAG